MSPERPVGTCRGEIGCVLFVKILKQKSRLSNALERDCMDLNNRSLNHVVTIVVFKMKEEELIETGVNGNHNICKYLLGLRSRH